MKITAQRVCAYTGFAMVGLFFVGFILSGFITPNSPQDSAQEIAQMFDDDRTAIRVGLVISTFAAALLVPWGMSVFMQLRRVEGRRSPLPHVVVLCATLFSLEFIYLIMFWQTALFRDELNPESIRMLNDLAWIPFVGITSTAIVMVLAMAFSILSDRRDEPIFPRWLGWFDLWVAFMFTPGTFNMFFKDGPLAYNGLIAWYVPVTVFGTFMVINTVFVVRAIGQEAEERSAIPTFREDGAPMEVEDLARELAELRREIGAKELTRA